MQLMPRLMILSAVVLAGCASQPTGPGGKHLIYSDASGTAIRQFDYPSDDFCRRVEKMAGGGARCVPDATVGANMPARATLRYNPPGVLVEAHYADMSRCQNETRQLGAGVEVVNACAAK